MQCRLFMEIQHFQCNAHKHRKGNNGAYSMQISNVVCDFFQTPYINNRLLQPFLIHFIYIYSFACYINSYWCQYVCLVHRCLTFALLPHQMNKKQPGHRSHPMRFLCDSICNKDIIGLGFAGHLWICIAIRGRCSPAVDPKVAANVGTKI